MPESKQPEATVLYADDSEAQRYALSRVLRRAGFDVVEANTGGQALEMMQGRPDVVVLDVNLPDISGIDVCQKIKSNPASARTPILHVSATLISTDARVAGLEGGADAYLVQPVAPDELIATVRALLRFRRADEELWRCNEQYRLFFEATPLPCCVFDTSDLAILAVNPSAVEVYGYSRQEFTHLTLRDVIFDGQFDAGTDLFQVQGAGRRLVQKHKTKQGLALDVEVTWSALRLDGRMACLAIVEDVTERRQRQEAEQKEQVRRLLLERVLQVQEEERQRLARELHDEAGQLMTSLLVGLRTLSDSRRLRDAKQQAEHLREIASQAITELSRLARGLHSSLLEDLGLEVAVRRYVDELATTHKVDIELEFGHTHLFALDQHSQLNLYRIIQEALTNVLRHAQATAIAIHFEEIGPELRICIRDNGRGLSAQAAHQDARHHLGIEGMRERAAILGGSLEVLSNSGQGVIVEVRVPKPATASHSVEKKSGVTKSA